MIFPGKISILNVMAGKTDTEVIIGGKVLTLSGSESEDYLQKVASYINNKIAEYAKNEAYKRQNSEMQAILMQLNIADDYFKARKQIEDLEDEVETKERELYNIKHELIAAQIKLENTEKNMKNLQNELTEAGKKIVKLETELGT